MIPKLLLPMVILPLIFSVPDSFATSKCQSVNGLPDPTCTPGAIDPNVTQENIHSTICVPGYTRTVRPPTSYTNPLKLQSMADYGFTDSPSNYEFDHLIPLELGGAPRDIKNLWPEPGFGDNNYHDKDILENELHSKVCSGTITLAEAQAEMAGNWETAPEFPAAFLMLTIPVAFVLVLRKRWTKS